MNKKIQDKAKKIKLIATDIDGVWTDAKMYYNADGVFMKAFSTYDGMATSILLKNNFIVVMITSEWENIERCPHKDGEDSCERVLHEFIIHNPCYTGEHCRDKEGRRLRDGDTRNKHCYQPRKKK